ncbi:MAG: hypothetical protein G8345_00800 [Magnetococcales bacterium]|nr:hypothetical protein [Magnetococcales bacterium]NGZ25407.1 hypothetical protein [Magnetococcales bacterium]
MNTNTIKHNEHNQNNLHHNGHDLLPMLAMEWFPMQPGLRLANGINLYRGSFLSQFFGGSMNSRAVSEGKEADWLHTLGGGTTHTDNQCGQSRKTNTGEGRDGNSLRLEGQT